MFRKLIAFLRGTEARAITIADDRTSQALHKPPLPQVDLEFSTTTETENRAENALPGTSEIELALRLVPPPLDLDILDVEANKDPNRNFLPDPIAECAVHYPAARRFDPKTLSGAMDKAFRESVLPKPSPDEWAARSLRRSTAKRPTVPTPCAKPYPALPASIKGSA
ncbi:hypothetical protein [Labrys sp. ZIDIC5]|uniref:hypothetical protein n=1 Tax=Labrys sedimenti TaxID=3106036 RepID=UPI002ACA50C5|nr:hypothetical protein [Labrys sp. ZIDIC5]MDZ5454098.1 hypothetical protein [Labrys sp. ZIDIC5]